MADFRIRSAQKELMDDPLADSTAVRDALRYVHFVNRYLGGYQALCSGLSQLVRHNPQKKHWNILDLGCGSGQELQVMMRWADKNNISATFTGLDINPEVVDLAKSNRDLQNLSFVCADALDPFFDYQPYDIVTGTLFFHHLTCEQIKRLFQKCNEQGVAVLVNDLHRSPVAWILFNIFARVTAAPNMALHDGALSIQRAFSKSELTHFATEGGYRHFSVQWKWAFRYLLLLWHEQKFD